MRLSGSESERLHRPSFQGETGPASTPLAVHEDGFAIGKQGIDGSHDVFDGGGEIVIPPRIVDDVPLSTSGVADEHFLRPAEGQDRPVIRAFARGIAISCVEP